MFFRRTKTANGLDGKSYYTYGPNGSKVPNPPQDFTASVS